MKTIVFDIHGILFSFSKRNDIKESGKLLDDKIKNLEQNFDKFKNAMTNNTIYLEAEYFIVKKAIMSNSDIKLYEMPNAIKTLLEYHRQGFKIVIISTSKIETTKLILEYLFKLNNVSGYQQVIYDMDIYNTDDYGSKSEYQVWQEIFSKYDSIDLVFEDKTKYLDAAKLAASNLKFDCEFHNKI